MKEVRKITNSLKIFLKITIRKRLNKRHSVEKRRQTHPTKKETSNHSFSKNSEERIGNLTRKRAFGKSRQND